MGITVKRIFIKRNTENERLDEFIENEVWTRKDGELVKTEVHDDEETENDKDA